jgi:hypothetical protein
LSAGQEEALVDKLVNVSNLSGDAAAEEVKDALGAALDSVGEDADELAEYLGSMNWQDASSWDQLQGIIESIGIEWTAEVQAFAN